MENSQQNSDLFNQPPPVNTGTLKVLTVLTFIGCALSYISLCWGAVRWGSYEQDLAQAQEMQDKLEDNWIGKMFQGSVEIMEKSHQYKYILFATGLVFTTFCLIGAMQMRKLKKSGYPLYVFGELAPVVVFAILMGFSTSSIISMGLSTLFALLFVILYSVQRKNLIN